MPKHVRRSNKLQTESLSRREPLHDRIQPPSGAADIRFASGVQPDVCPNPRLCIRQTLVIRYSECLPISPHRCQRPACAVVPGSSPHAARLRIARAVRLPPFLRPLPEGVTSARQRSFGAVIICTARSLNPSLYRDIPRSFAAHCRFDCQQNGRDNQPDTGGGPSLRGWCLLLLTAHRRTNLETQRAASGNGCGPYCV
jgi:hypothetical protein